jgi:hypothetical protein
MSVVHMGPPLQTAQSSHFLLLRGSMTRWVGLTVVSWNAKKGVPKLMCAKLKRKNLACMVKEAWFAESLMLLSNVVNPNSMM